MSEIVDSSPNVSFDDIAGLQFAKNTLEEIIIFPMLRPDLFSGLRSPPKVKFIRNFMIFSNNGFFL